MDIKYTHPSVQISEVLKQIYTSRLTTTSGGNISMKGDHDNVWITPAAVDKGSLTDKDIVKVKPDGATEGLHRPSSELPFHQAIYKKRPDIGAVIHAHPPALVSFSIVRQLPDTSIIPQAEYLCGKVGYAPYKLPGSEELGKSIADEFEKGYNAIIMENHGTVVGGKDLMEAFMRFETLEFCARTIIRAKILGDVHGLDDEKIRAFEHRDNMLPEFESEEHSAEERKIRHQVCDVIRRACDQRLMISSYGTISARINENEFIINPTNFNRRYVELRDLVKIKNGQREKGKTPSRAVKLHQNIYRNHPEVNCIISTQSPNVTAFCVANKKLDTRTIPESYILLEDIPLMDFGSQFSEGEEIVKVLGKHVPIALLKNDSILVTGKSILETFDRLEVAEFSAASLIDSMGIGSLSPIKDTELEELKSKFLKD